MKPRTRTHPASVTRATDLLRLLADPTRFQIIRLLLKDRRGVPVYVIAETLEKTHSSVSHQLGTLEAGGLIEGNRDGQTVTYRIGRTRRAQMAVRIVRSL